MQLDDLGYAAELDGGIRCGAHPRGVKVYHDSVETVRFCYATMREQIAQQQAELAAERANERYFEDRGWEEARAQEDYEARMGMVDFGTAYREACPELFADENEA
jgi:hypothetical protein